MDRFRVALIGTSFAKNVQAVGFQRHPGFELAAIAGSDEAKTRRIADELGIPLAYGDWRRMLDDAGAQLVSVATPVDLHHPMVLASLERGAHVLCEKPTALHRFQAAEMRDRAALAGRVAAINHEFRFFPARRQALALVKRGAIGTPRRGEILGRYALWPRPESRGMTWLSDRARGGGILGALGSHHTDCLRVFFGEPRSVLASVRVDQPLRGTGEAQRRATADDACTLHYEFANGATGIIDLSACTPYRWERFEIHGEEATLRWDETGETLMRLAAGRDAEQVEIADRDRPAKRAGDPALLPPFTVVVARLYAAIDRGDPLVPGFAADAVPVQAALDAARASSAAGKRVAVAVP
jgi:predicted dehydrogenase